MGKSWSKEEIELFKKLYPTEPMNKLIKQFGRDKSALMTKANRLGIKREIKSDGSRYFSEEEKEYIKENCLTKSYEEIANDLGRSSKSISSIAHEIGANSGFWWTDEDKQFLIEHFSTGDREFICKKLNKKWKAIGKKAREMGLNRVKVNGEKYSKSRPATKKEDVFILKNYKDMTSSEMARKLKRSEVFIDKRCLDLNIKSFRQRKNLSDFSDEDLLQSLRTLEKELKRTPSIQDVQKDKRFPSVDTYYDRFGSYIDALILSGVDIISNSTFGKRCFSKNGDICYSIPEKDITDFFIDNNIFYTKEVLYSRFIPSFDKKYRADWVLEDGLVVEYFGLENTKRYMEKTKYKTELCNNNNIFLLGLYKNDLNNLNAIFKNYIY